ncbi:stage III sporulation protein AF [Mesobacillus foraminis]|uniref:Stage III sporulation protein AF n=1 Tax=Mesobacillus foraminis TaxID=279826 RepID=A0A4R2BA49_9BACI|nr:stage III sporulation protein AF [Mesobacillus foraminis]TCN22912.1 stage III sporulation protein AF [Mesobacillus foraminis]
MDFLKAWITNIILFILIATVIDMLLPNSSLQKYVKVVVGLLLISIILSPVMKLFTSDFETAIASLSKIQGSLENKNIENSIDSQKKEIQASQQAYILEQMAVQLKMDAEEELMEQHDMEIAGIQVKANETDETLTPESLESITVEIAEPGGEEESVTAVKEIKIDTEQPLQSEQDAINTDQVTSLLAEKWNVPKETIQIVVKGGT